MPWLATRETTTTPIAPVAPEIMPGRPPRIGGDQADDEGGVEPDQRGHAREEGEGDRLGDERERDGEAREDLAPWRAREARPQVEGDRRGAHELGQADGDLGHVCNLPGCSVDRAHLKDAEPAG
jgi:hypothetical protein